MLSSSVANNILLKLCIAKIAFLDFASNRDTISWDSFLNSLMWPSDATWQPIFGLMLTQVMACCLAAPSHYMHQCWLLISKGLWHSPESIFTASVQATILYNKF